MPSSTTTAFPSLDSDLVRKALSFSSSSLTKANEHSRENFAAVAASATALTGGTRDLVAQSQAFGKSVIESNVATLKALTCARSPQDVIELQTNHTKASIELCIAGVSGIAETYASAFKAAFAPFQARAKSLKAAAPAFPET